MDNEKSKILKMLEEGRITADEAARLLDAFKDKGSPAEQGPGYSHDGDAPRSNAGGRGPSSVGLDDFAADMSRKFDELARDLEPKLRKATEKVVEKTAGIADRISKSLEASREDVSRGGRREDTPRAASSGGGRASTHNFSCKVTAGGELNLAGMNAPVNVKGYNGDTVTLNVTCRAKRPAHSGEGVVFRQLGDKYTLLYNEYEFDSVAIDAFVPASMFTFIAVQTVNAGLTVSGLSCKNGRLDNFNGDVSVSDLDIENLKLTTSNSAVNISVGEFSVFHDYIWSVETSNGSVNLNLPFNNRYGYHVRAHASLSSVRIGLVGMNFLNNDGPNAEAISVNYDDKPTRVKLSLETSYAPIIVN